MTILGTAFLPDALGPKDLAAFASYSFFSGLYDMKAKGSE